ncbi:UvrD-helicase domain-containing protein [Spirochaeta thermophila]|uniref:DNA 3'-5' helicase n=1 Tax=Winmispira thermophila (strain ATCC 49972 / DSM 6192 / RI 19.B1) TaxID=665571 RepID=E0RU03_WINT6|nr:UvrD-helicase domain-containing protein [Spirochaeta thermophila]ADN01059.1 hypothetical protein STHERM_c00830 [Spirochaeta thermophila DSM 6192]
MNLNEDQRRAVETEKTAVVIAGAGSGKTRVLTERYLRLVRNGVQPSRILALTFTRKAAAEMHERISQGIRGLARSSHGLLEDFENAHISTLDSFCALVLRPHALGFGIRPDFGMCAADDLEGLESRALSFLLSKKDRPGVRRLIHSWGLDRVVNDFLCHYGRNHAMVGAVPDPEEWEEWYQEKVEEAFTSVDEGMERCGDFVRECAREARILEEERKREKKKVSESIGKLIDAGTMWEVVEAAWDRVRSRREGGSGLVPEVVREWREALDEVASSLKGLRVDELRDAIDTLKKELGVGKKPPSSSLSAVAGDLVSLLERREEASSLFGVLAEWHGEVERFKKERNLLTFGDVMHLVLTLLKEEKEVREFYKGRFDAILVDEFQDNNGLQRDLLFLLAERKGRCGDGVPSFEDLEPGKLFVVGDEKQSIYLFRGADVGVFLDLKERANRSSHGEVMRLPHNYRSEPGLLDAVNRMAGAFPEEMRGGIEFLPAEAGREGAGFTPRIEAGVYVKEEEKARAEGRDLVDAGTAEAWWVAGRIRRWVEEGELVVRDGEEVRPVRYGDIAVLMRTGTNQLAFERAFRAHGIPYTAAYSRNLFLEAPANDLFSWLFIAVYPHDLLSYAAVLRGPLVGLSDRDILRLIEREEGCFSLSREEVEEMLGDEEELLRERVERYERGKEIYDWLVSHRDRVPHERLLRYLWVDCGYRMVLLGREQLHPFLRFYDELVAFVRRWEERPLARCLDEVKEELGRYGRVDVEEGRGEDAVRIMTIHAAKGLEFPVVVLASCGAESRREGEGKMPYFMVEGVPAFGFEGDEEGKKENPLYRRAAEEMKKKEAEEMLRLLYVGLTRAQSHLLITGEWRGAVGKEEHGADDGSKKTVPSFMSLLFEAKIEEPEVRFKADQEGIAGVEWRDPERIPGITEEELRERVGSGSRGGRWEEAARWYEEVDEGVGGVRPGVLSVSVLAGEWEAERGGEARGRGAVFGSLVHRGMVLWARLGDEGRVREALRGEALAWGGDGEWGEVDRVCEEAAALVRRWAESEVGREVLGNGAGWEVECVAEWEGRVLHGVMDAVWVGDGVVRIYEWKTEEEPDVERYRAQLFLYGLIASRVWPGRRVECVLGVPGGRMWRGVWGMEGEWEEVAAWVRGRLGITI